MYSFSFNLPGVFSPNRLERHLLSAREAFYVYLSVFVGNLPSLLKKHIPSLLNIVLKIRLAFYWILCFWAGNVMQCTVLKGTVILSYSRTPVTRTLTGHDCNVNFVA